MNTIIARFTVFAGIASLVIGCSKKESRSVRTETGVMSDPQFSNSQTSGVQTITGLKSDPQFPKELPQDKK